MSDPMSAAPSASQVRAQSRAYRSGLVLGLTMAEIMLLLLFVMLLIIGATWSYTRTVLEKNARYAEVFQKLASRGISPEDIVQIETERAALIEKLVAADKAVMNESYYEDILRLLTLSDGSRPSPQQVAEKLRQISEIEKSGPVRVDAIASDRAIADAARKTFGGGTEKKLLEDFKTVEELQQVAGESPQELLKDLAAIRQEAGPLKDALREIRLAKALKEGLGGKSAAELVERARAWEEATKKLELQPGETPLQAIERVAREFDNAQGQVKQIQEQFQKIGKTVFPSCWVTKEGKEESLVDVIFGAGGIEVRERPLPHRASERAQLPLDGARFGQLLSPREFTVDFRKVNEWSVERNCRFYMVRWTRTGVSDRMSDRAQVNAVENYFYPGSSLRVWQE